LLAESRFLRDREGSAFVSLLNFDPKLLDDIIQHNRTREGIADVVLDRDALARGFQSVWIYMETLIELSSTLQQENAPFSKRLDARLRQLTRWRVNKHLGVDEHFTRVALLSTSATAVRSSMRSRWNTALNAYWGHGASHI